MIKSILRNRFLLLSFCFFLLNINSFAQENSQNYWQDVDESIIQQTGDKQINPIMYRTIRLDVEAMTSMLNSAPMELLNSIKTDKAVISLPIPNGTYQQFAFQGTYIMHPDLAARYPETKTFVGKGIDDPHAYIRFDMTPHGFHAMVLSPNGGFYIDPYTQWNNENYISYYITDFNKEDYIDCELIATESALAEMEYLMAEDIDIPIGPTLRTYRLANATTVEYSTFHGSTVSLVLAAVVTAVNRVVGVYEKEIAVRMQLIPNNDTLIYSTANGYTTSSDPYSNLNGGLMLNENISNCNSVIGAANYDIGHVFSTGGGGVAYLASVCGSSKAGGVTGLPSPIGDPFYIDYVAHEMGHQFGGNHTFNGSSGSCSGGNRSASSAYEPGSGSTIMAYAGICSPQNIQNFSDPYFHVRSFDEMVAFTNNGSGNGCAVQTSTGNNAPLVTVPAGGWVIPISTPFSLTGSATDPNGDTLTYCWEEWDLGPTGAPGTPSGDAPIFRSWLPTTSSTRYFPRLSNLLNNTTVMGELLPTYARNLKFRMIARDNKPGGGGVDYAQVNFTVSAAAGPFVVTSPNTNVSIPGNSFHTITWNVANTNLAPVNTANVKISLSTDGGLTFPIVLAASTANDGTEDLLIPNNVSTTARIKIEAVDNIYFDLSNVNFTIEQEIPVELTSFTADYSEKVVRLDWRTATETNNSGFEIQRAVDGSEFEKVGFVQGNGTTVAENKYSFVDNSVKVASYQYRLKQIDFNGTFEYSTVVLVDVNMPSNFDLAQNHPNPFNPTTMIRFELPIESIVTLNVYNSIGQRVAEVLNQSFEGGLHEINFDASHLSSGIYYYSITAAGKNGSNFSTTKKMILMK